MGVRCQAGERVSPGGNCGRGPGLSCHRGAGVQTCPHRDTRTHVCTSLGERIRARESTYRCELTRASEAHATSQSPPFISICLSLQLPSPTLAPFTNLKASLSALPCRSLVSGPGGSERTLGRGMRCWSPKSLAAPVGQVSPGRILFWAFLRSLSRPRFYLPPSASLVLSQPEGTFTLSPICPSSASSELWVEGTWVVRQFLPSWWKLWETLFLNPSLPPPSGDCRGSSRSPALGGAKFLSQAHRPASLSVPSRV